MEVLKFIYYGLMLTSLAVLLFNIKGLPNYCRWFVPIIALGIIVQVVSEILEMRQVNSYFIFHYYQPIECLLLLGFYHNIVLNRSKLLVVISFFAYVLALCVHYFRLPASFYTWDFFDFAVQALIICLFVTIFFLQLLKNQEKTDLKHFPAFWLNAAHLIFYGGCLFVMGLYFYIKNNDSHLARNVLSINHFLNLFLYAAYTIIFACTVTPKK